MKRISFHIKPGFDVYKELFFGISGYAVECPHDFKTAVGIWLFRKDMSAILILCSMVDVGPRFEVGTLSISLEDHVPDSLEPVVLPDDWSRIKNIFRLEIIEHLNDEDEVVTESGIILEAEDGGELAVLAGVAPYTLAIKINDDEKLFYPQYHLGEYFRLPISI